MMMMMHKALNSGDDRDSLYVSRQKGGRGLTSIEDYEDALIKGLEENIKKSKVRLITMVSKSPVKHKDKQNNRKKEMGRKTNVWIFQTTNWQTLAQEDVNIAKKGNLERGTESLQSGTKQCRKDQLY